MQRIKKLPMKILAATDAYSLTGFPKVHLCELVVAKPSSWSCVYVSEMLDTHLPHSDATSIEIRADRALPRIPNKGVCIWPTGCHRIGSSEPSIHSKKTIKGTYHFFKEIRILSDLGVCRDINVNTGSALMKYDSTQRSLSRIWMKTFE